MTVDRPLITKFTNGQLLRNGELVPGDLWVSSETGRIISPQSAFYDQKMTADRVIDLQGKILSPGFMDVQLNGGHGFDFSTPEVDYVSKLGETNRKLIHSGVTSYLPTVISSKPQIYQAVLPSLGPSGHDRDASKGSESLGAHIEGPFLSPAKNGIHSPEILQAAESMSDIEECYGKENLNNVRKMTAAPERGNMMSLIPEITSKNIIFSIGHSDATFEQAQSALAAGATMVTHMFNAMRPFGHREPGIFGLLGQSAPPTPIGSPRPSRPSSAHSSPPSSPRSTTSSLKRSSLSISTSITDLSSLPPATPPQQPFFGLIADGIHLSSQAVKIAYLASPHTAILVTDAIKMAGLPDGIYDWTNGTKIVKKGSMCTHETNGRLAGAASTLLECVNNFRRFTGVGTAKALECVTSTPARMLGQDVEKVKGKLETGMDADLVVLEEGADGELRVDGVWKFGVQVA